MDTNGDPPKPSFKIDIDFGVPFNRLVVTLQQIIEICAVGLTAELPTPDAFLELPGSPVQFNPAQNTKKPAGELLPAFRAWVVSGALRDALECVGPLLDDVRFACAAFQLGSKGTTTREEVERELQARGAEFQALGLPKRLKFLKDEYSGTIGSPLESHFFTLNAARNCFAHRAGIVGPPDAAANGTFTLRWQRWAVAVPEGDKLRYYAVGEAFPAGEGRKVRLADTAKVFRLGERIELTSTEFAEICQTIWFFGAQIIGSVQAHGSRMGIPMRGGPDKGGEPRPAR